MRKRTSLATTTVYEAKIILMDKPLSALDVRTRNLMENELLEIWAQERKTVLFISHDLEEAIALSDRVIVLTAAPSKVKGAYDIPLGRPSSVTKVRSHPAFGDLYEAMWPGPSRPRRKPSPPTASPPERRSQVCSAPSRPSGKSPTPPRWIPKD